MRWKLVIPLAAFFVIGLTFFSGPAIEEANAPPLVKTAVAAEGMVPPGYAWHGNLRTDRWCLPNGNTGYEVNANSEWSPFEVTWSGNLPNGELSPGGSASGSATFTWPDAPGESGTQDWSVDAKNCPLPTPTPTEEPTPTPELRVDWKPLAVCDVEPDEVEIRGHNVNSVSIKITGQLFALPDGEVEKLISEVPPQYQEVSPNGWGGPEERIRNHFSYFSGVVYGWAEAHTLDGQLIDRFEMKPTRLLCGEEPTPTPEPTDPAPVCPTCDPHRDEFGNEGEVVMAQTSETACNITWNEEKEEWCDGMTPYPMIYSGGHPISVLDLITLIATPLEAFEGESFTHYFLEGDAIADPTWRTMKPLYGLHEGQLTWWDLDPANPDRIKSAWEVVGINNVRMEYPCGRTPGVWDIVDGNLFNWNVGHNVSEVALWARDNFDISYAESVDWARQLSQAGVGSSLPLPEIQTASVSTEEASVSSLSPDGNREAFLQDGNLWIRWTFERTDGFPQEWDTGVAAESVDSWDTNWVITITQDGESYQTDQFASFLNLIEVET